ncbi:MAG: ATP-binding protein [Phormidesmis priestleyi]|uniref:ATP-binding protein n=1 Tax=Phormidesmis priestleyi TaxID=268141 RepID=A0A2W4ZD84_9CYAN|nr:MAG: ATP-binding protein [Phormidesmis priestleyi]
MRDFARRPTRDGTSSADLNGLLPFLEWVDKRLAHAIAALPTEEGKGSSNPFPGLIQPSPEQLEHWLTQSPRVSSFPEQQKIAIEQLIPRPDSSVGWLQQTFGLSAVDLLIVAIALAPEVDRRYERLYAYLQDDVRYKRPTVDLALNLLGQSAPEKLMYRTFFATDAPLMQQGLLHLVQNSPTSRSTLLARELHLDEQVVNWLLHQPGLDRQLEPFCALVSSMAVALQPQAQGLFTLVVHHWQTEQPLRLYFQGIDPVAKRHRAESMAAYLGVPLLIGDLARLTDENAEFNTTVQRLLREAQFQGALLYLENLDRLQDTEDGNRYDLLIKGIATCPKVVILSGHQPYRPIPEHSRGVLTITFALPDADQRRDLWRAAAEVYGLTFDEMGLQALGDRFQLTATQIRDAGATAWNKARLAAAETDVTDHAHATPALSDFFAAARAQAGHDLTTLARKLEARPSWDDIVLPPHQTLLLQELCQEARYQTQVWKTWGFAKKLSLGQGLNVLFSGPPGTGKTFTAEVLAHELDLDLYQIDLSQMVSKYIGATEKNLNRVFTAAANANAILLFDEADALFGKRSEVKDARDRYANIETSYLLQKMEEYEGVAILTTNFRSNIDEAFVRRLRYIVEFAMPGEQERQRIWERIWPDPTPRHPDLDLAFMASQFELPGANIRNIALRAAFLAASEGGMVEMKHLITALQREYQKMGKMLMLDQMGEYAQFV